MIRIQCKTLDLESIMFKHIITKMYFKMGITKSCTLLNPAHFSLPNSLQHPQQYLNQNIARNWTVSPNVGQKVKSCPFWLKIGTHDTLEVLIPNPDLDLRNFDPKIHFWANLAPKIQRCPFCLKVGTHSTSRMLIPNPDLDFWNFDPRIHFWENLDPKNQSCPFFLKIGTHGISRMLILIPTLILWIFINFLLGTFGPKKSIVLPKGWHTWYLEYADSYFNICFLNFKLKIHFWANLGQKSQICQFCLTIGTLGILRMWILSPTLVF